MAATYYLIRGIEPPDLRLYPDTIKILYWEWVVELGLKAKDADLAKGLDKDGKPLRGISERTRKNRRSAMTPTGRGDPSAPALMPGRGLSRTRSLLTGRARKNYAEFFWRYDPWTGDQWGKILAYHAQGRTAGGIVRNVVGLSPASTAKVAAAAAQKWEAWKRTQPGPSEIVISRKIASMPAGQSRPRTVVAPPSPWRTVTQLETFARQPVARPRLQNARVTAPSVRAGALNQLLAWLWGKVS